MCRVFDPQHGLSLTSLRHITPGLTYWELPAVNLAPRATAHLAGNSEIVHLEMPERVLCLKFEGRRIARFNIQ